MAGIWTRNYYNLLTALIGQDMASGSSSAPSSYDPPIRVRDYTGAYFTPSNGLFVNIASGNLTQKLAKAYANPFLIGKCTAGYGVGQGDFRNMSIAFGTGSGTAGYEDYNISGQVGLSIANVNGSLTEPSHLDGEHIKSKREYVVTNGSSSTYNITNFGIFVNVTDGTWSNEVLVYHEYFDETVALAPGESFIITFEHDVPIYNYTPYPA